MPAASGDATPSGERPVSRPRKTARKTTSKPRRTTREEYLALAREAHRPGIVVTPKWVREAVPDISRGTSQVVSNLLNAELSTPRLTAEPVDAHNTTDTTTVISADTSTDAGVAIEQREAA